MMNLHAEEQAISRLRWLARIFVSWALIILSRLIYLQIVAHDEYARSAIAQQQKLVEIQAPRGTIYDRNGHPLAMSVPADSVCINPMRLPDRSVAAEVLAGALGLDREELRFEIEQAYAKGRGFLWIKRKISREESERLRAYGLEWIEFRKESRRVYPKASVGAHVIGSVNHEELGNSGIELSLDEELEGHAGSERMVTDVRQRGFDATVAAQAEPGCNLTLAIDERIQYIAERELTKAAEANHCWTGSVVVMNPRNGEVLALANHPGFDPNELPKAGESLAARLNLGISAPFEPGSVFKIITLSAALETTRLRPESLINCGGGTINLFGRVIHEAKHGYGTLTMADVLAKSSNIGAIQIGLQVGPENLYRYVKAFGFGKPTGISLPAESAGMLRDLRRWGKTSIGSVAMGHEVSTTAIQLATACSAIANGGLLMRPRILLTTERPGGGVEPVPVTPPRRVIQPDTAVIMRQMMEGVILKPYGTGHRTAKLVGYSAGGKTGSAQIFDFKTRQYTHKYNASFVGFAPVNNPAIVVAVTLNGSSLFGGVVAGPVFRAVATEALRLLDVPKDIPEQEADDDDAPVDMNDVAIAELSTPPSPSVGEPGEAQAAPEPALLHAALSLGPRVPNFSGKTVRAVLEESAAMGLPVEFVGSGIARAQAPAAGSVLPPGGCVRVQFAR